MRLQRPIFRLAKVNSLFPNQRHKSDGCYLLRYVQLHLQNYIYTWKVVTWYHSNNNKVTVLEAHQPQLSFSRGFPNFHSDYLEPKSWAQNHRKDYQLVWRDGSVLWSHQRSPRVRNILYHQSHPFLSFAKWPVRFVRQNAQLWACPRCLSELD